MPKVSIIVPTYNNDKYLKACIDSIIAQTLKEIEIIIVNDGSTDNTALICDAYSEQDKRIRVIHKENEGLGKAYNTGILAANGDYIGFVESDDFISSTMYEDLYRLAKRSNVDMVKSSWFEFDNQNGKNKDLYLSEYNSHEVLDKSSIGHLLTIRSSVWSAIYRTSYLLENNVFFLETPGASYQDVSFTYKAIAKADGIIVSPDAYLYYRQDNENASIKSKEKVNDIFVEYDEVNNFFNTNSDLKKLYNTYKLVKEFNDYNWNLNRIRYEYKKSFMDEFYKRFEAYQENYELTNEFFEYIDPKYYGKTLGQTFN
ncbi:glycosyltransferase [bacterium]|nr:glycosyltransferase [bacterium]